MYVHSKLMIVDDNACIIGSANINDRSMLGMRDSEIAVVIQDVEFNKLKVGEEERDCGKFVGSLRRNIWAEHIGVTRAEDDTNVFADPVKCRSLVENIATKNTAIYEDIFGVIPSDQITSWAAMSTAMGRRTPDCATIDVTKPPRDDGAAKAALENIKGHIVRYPLRFLEQEQLDAFTKVTDKLTPTDIFN